MKKSNVLKYIIFTFICLCPLMKVNAYLYYIGGDNSKIIREEEVNKREILLVCSYAQKESNYSGGANDYWTSYFERLNIYYTYSGNWEISYDKGVKVFESANKDKYKNQALFATNVYMTEETRKNLNKGICPAQGFIDYAGNDEICFGDASFCRSKSNFGTGFAIENSQKVVTSEKNYDINEDMNIYFEKWVPTFQNCDEFRKSPTNVTDKLKEDFVKNFLNSEKENNVPKFFSKNPTYIQGFDGMKKIWGI